MKDQIIIPAGQSGNYIPMDMGNIKAAVWQLERANTGTLHYQMTLQVKNPTTIGRIQKLVGVPNCHVEVTKSVEGSIQYCQKEDSRIEGPWFHGSFDGRKRGREIVEMAESGATTWEIVKKYDLYLNARAIDSLVALVPRPIDISVRPTVIILTGPSGIGKSTFVKHELGLDGSDICRAICEKGTWYFNAITPRTKVVLYDEVAVQGIPARDFRAYVNFDVGTWPRKLNSPIMCKPEYVIITTNLRDWQHVFSGLDNEGTDGSAATLSRISVVATRASLDVPWSVVHGDSEALKKTLRSS